MVAANYGKGAGLKLLLMLIIVWNLDFSNQMRENKPVNWFELSRGLKNWGKATVFDW